MAKIDLKLIQELREKTGLGMMDCKKALQETDGSIEKAIELLRKKGAKIASKRSLKETAEHLGIKVKTVEAHLTKALVRCADYMAEEELLGSQNRHSNLAQNQPADSARENRND